MKGRRLFGIFLVLISLTLSIFNLKLTGAVIGLNTSGFLSLISTIVLVFGAVLAIKKDYI